MKILFNTYPMAFHTPGGGEVQLLQYKKHLEASGVDVELLNLWKPTFQDYDAVHFFSCISGSLHFSAFIKKLGLPLLVSPNLWITEENKHQYPYEEVRQHMVVADKVICNSDSECNLLANTFNMPREKFETVYNGVDEMFLEAVSPSLFREHYGIKQPFILNVANIEPRKNQLALAKALKEFPHLKLIIIGHERDAEYAKLCYAAGGEQLCYLGSLPHDSKLLRSAFAACEAFALPSLLETPGLAALEAAASGAKIVVTKEGSASEYFGEYVEYVNPLDVQDIKRGIQKVIENSQGVELRNHVKMHFTWERVMVKLHNVYKRMLLKDVFNCLISVQGFYESEKYENSSFAWGRKYIALNCSSGLLSFNWRSVHGARVDIWIDGESIHHGLYVGSDWSSFTLAIQAKNDDNCLVEIKTTLEDIGLINDPRELAIAFKDVQYIKEV